MPPTRNQDGLFDKALAEAGCPPRAETRKAIDATCEKHTSQLKTSTFKAPEPPAGKRFKSRK